MSEDLVLIGKVIKPHGLKGEVKVASFAESLETFHKVERLYLKEKAGGMRPLRVGRIASHKDLAILSFEGISGVDGADTIKGLELYIEKDALDKLPEGEYYRYELIGLDVETVGGRELGRISDVFPTGSNDVLVVNKGSKEYLLPALKDIIREVDLKKGKMVIEPPDDLIED